ncbi:MAG: protein-export chaperone SecB [Thioalkalispiraceae bacterium]|jgi:preprotein translocase subunit SecB
MSDNEQAKSETEQQFAINKIYIKDVSFESPNSPAQFTAEWKPESNLELNTNGKPLEDNVYEVVLSLTVTVKNQEQTAYLVEVQQCGIFSIAGFNDEDLSHMLGSFCPNILFPYAREAVSDLVTRGGFPQLLLAPVNFDALYAQHVQQLQKQAEQQESH